MIAPYPAQRTPLQAALWAALGPFALVFLYSCGTNLFLLAPSIYLLQIYDRVLSSHSLHTLWMLTLIVGLGVTVGALLDVVRRAGLSRIGSWFEHRLRPSVLAATFEYAARGDPRFANECYRDLITIRQFLDSPASALLFDVPWAPLFLGLLFLVHPILGAIGLAGAATIFAAALATELATRAPLRIANAAQVESVSFLALVLNYIQVVRAMRMQAGAARRVFEAAEVGRTAQDIVSRRNIVIQAFAKPVRGLTQVLMMGAAAWLVVEENRNAGIIFASSLLIGRGLAPIEGAVGAWKAFAVARAACRRLSQLFVAVGPALEAKGHVLPKPEGYLNLDNVSLNSPSRTYLLKGISLQLAPGDCLALIGPSGSGKSLLGRVIAGVAAPSSGRALLDSIDLSTLRGSGGSHHIGYLPQEIELFGGAIRDVISRLGDPDADRVTEAAKVVGLHESIMKLPQAYDTDIADANVNFLRSQRQQLGLARAIYGRPRLVVLDEPNASLDYHGERMLSDLIEFLKAQKITVVVISHRMGVLPTTTKIGILQNGALTAFGESQMIFDKHLRPREVADVPTNSAATRPEQSAEKGSNRTRDGGLQEEVVSA
jgi:ATP-binding cassette subfamily C protein